MVLHMFDAFPFSSVVAFQCLLVAQYIYCFDSDISDKINGYKWKEIGLERWGLQDDNGPILYFGLEVRFHGK